MRLLEVFEQLNPNCLLLTVHTGSAILAKDTKAELTWSWIQKFPLTISWMYIKRNTHQDHYSIVHYNAFRIVFLPCVWPQTLRKAILNVKYWWELTKTLMSWMENNHSLSITFTVISCIPWHTNSLSSEIWIYAIYSLLSADSLT